MSTRKVTGQKLAPASKQKSEAKKPPVRKRQYHLLVSADENLFGENIEAWLADGWELHGPPMMVSYEQSHWQFAQALVRTGKV